MANRAALIIDFEEEDPLEPDSQAATWASGGRSRAELQSTSASDAAALQDPHAEIERLKKQIAAAEAAAAKHKAEKARAPVTLQPVQLLNTPASTGLPGAAGTALRVVNRGAVSANGRAQVSAAVPSFGRNLQQPGPPRLNTPPPLNAAVSQQQQKGRLAGLHPFGGSKSAAAATAPLPSKSVDAAKPPSKPAAKLQSPADAAQDFLESLERSDTPDVPKESGTTSRGFQMPTGQTIMDLRFNEGYRQAPFMDASMQFAQGFGGFPPFQPVSFMGHHPMLPMPFGGPLGGMMPFQDPMGGLPHPLQAHPPRQGAPPPHRPAAPAAPPKSSSTTEKKQGSLVQKARATASKMPSKAGLQGAGQDSHESSDKPPPPPSEPPPASTALEKAKPVRPAPSSAEVQSRQGKPENRVPQIAHGAPKAASKQVPAKEGPREVPKQASKQVPPKEAPRNTPQPKAKEVPKNAPKEVPKTAPKEVPSSATKEVLKKAELAALATKNAPLPAQETPPLPAEVARLPPVLNQAVSVLTPAPQKEKEQPSGKATTAEPASPTAGLRVNLREVLRQKDALWLRRKVLDQIFEDARLEFNSLRSKEAELVKSLGTEAEEIMKETFLLPDLLQLASDLSKETLADSGGDFAASRLQRLEARREEFAAATREERKKLELEDKDLPSLLTRADSSMSLERGDSGTALPGNDSRVEQIEGSKSANPAASDRSESAVKRKRTPTAPDEPPSQRPKTSGATLDDLRKKLLEKSSKIAALRGKGAEVKQAAKGDGAENTPKPAEPPTALKRPDSLSGSRLSDPADKRKDSGERRSDVLERHSGARRVQDAHPASPPSPSKDARSPRTRPPAGKQEDIDRELRKPIARAADASDRAARSRRQSRSPSRQRKSRSPVRKSRSPVRRQALRRKTRSPSRSRSRSRGRPYRTVRRRTRSPSRVRRRTRSASRDRRTSTSRSRSPAYRRRDDRSRYRRRADSPPRRPRARSRDSSSSERSARRRDESPRQRSALFKQKDRPLSPILPRPELPDLKSPDSKKTDGSPRSQTADKRPAEPKAVEIKAIEKTPADLKAAETKAAEKLGGEKQAAGAVTAAEATAAPSNDLANEIISLLRTGVLSAKAEGLKTSKEAQQVAKAIYGVIKSFAEEDRLPPEPQPARHSSVKPLLMAIHKATASVLPPGKIAGELAKRAGTVAELVAEEISMARLDVLRPTETSANRSGQSKEAAGSPKSVQLPTSGRSRPVIDSPKSEHKQGAGRGHPGSARRAAAQTASRKPAPKLPPSQALSPAEKSPQNATTPSSIHDGGSRTATEADENRSKTPLKSPPSEKGEGKGLASLPVPSARTPSAADNEAPPPPPLPPPPAAASEVAIPGLAQERSNAAVPASPAAKLNFAFGTSSQRPAATTPVLKGKAVRDPVPSIPRASSQKEPAAQAVQTPSKIPGLQPSQLTATPATAGPAGWGTTPAGAATKQWTAAASPTAPTPLAPIAVQKLPAQEQEQLKEAAPPQAEDSEEEVLGGVFAKPATAAAKQAAKPSFVFNLGSQAAEAAASPSPESASCFGVVSQTGLPALEQLQASLSIPQASQLEAPVTDDSTKPYESPLLSFKSYRLCPTYKTVAKMPLSTRTYAHSVRPNWPLCPFEVRGSCRDVRCAFQMNMDTTLTNIEVLQSLQVLARRAGAEPVLPPPSIAAESKLLETHAKALLKDAQPGILVEPQPRSKPSQKQRIPSDQVHAAGVGGEVSSYVLLGGVQPHSFFRSIILSSALVQQPMFEGGGFHGLEGFPKAPPDRQRLKKGTADDRRYFSSRVSKPEGGELPSEAGGSTLTDLDNEETWLKSAVEALQEGQISALKVLAKALDKIQTSPSIWTLYAHLYGSHAASQPKEDIREIWNAAIKYQPQSYHLWLVCLANTPTIQARARLLQRGIVAFAAAPAGESAAAAEARTAALLDLWLRLMLLMSSSLKGELQTWISQLSLDTIGPTIKLMSSAETEEAEEKQLAGLARQALRHSFASQPGHSLVMWQAAAYLAAYNELPSVYVHRLGHRQKVEAITFPSSPPASIRQRVYTVLSAACGSGVACLNLRAAAEGSGSVYTSLEGAEAVQSMALTLARWQTISGSPAVVTAAGISADRFRGLQPLLVVSCRASEFVKRAVQKENAEPPAEKDVQEQLVQKEAAEQPMESVRESSQLMQLAILKHGEACVRDLLAPASPRVRQPSPGELRGSPKPHSRLAQTSTKAGAKAKAKPTAEPLATQSVAKLTTKSAPWLKELYNLHSQDRNAFQTRLNALSNDDRKLFKDFCNRVKEMKAAKAAEEAARLPALLKRAKKCLEALEGCLKELPGGLVKVQSGLPGIPPASLAALVAKAFQMSEGTPEPALALLAASVISATEWSSPTRAAGRPQEEQTVGSKRSRDVPSESRRGRSRSPKRRGSPRSTSHSRNVRHRHRSRSSSRSIKSWSRGQSRSPRAADRTQGKHTTMSPERSRSLTPEPQKTHWNDLLEESKSTSLAGSTRLREAFKAILFPNKPSENRSSPEEGEIQDEDGVVEQDSMPPREWNASDTAWTWLNLALFELLSGENGDAAFAAFEKGLAAVEGALKEEIWAQYLTVAGAVLLPAGPKQKVRTGRSRQAAGLFVQLVGRYLSWTERKAKLEPLHVPKERFLDRGLQKKLAHPHTASSDAAAATLVPLLPRLRRDELVTVAEMALTLQPPSAGSAAIAVEAFALRAKDEAWASWAAPLAAEALASAIPTPAPAIWLKAITLTEQHFPAAAQELSACAHRRLPFCQAIAEKYAALSGAVGGAVASEAAARVARRAFQSNP